MVYFTSTLEEIMRLSYGNTPKWQRTDSINNPSFGIFPKKDIPAWFR